MNWYLYNARYSSHMTDVSDSLYNSYADRPHQSYGMFKDENTAKNLPVIHVNRLEPTNYVLIECPLSELTTYLQLIGKSWVGTDFKENQTKYAFFRTTNIEMYCVSVSDEAYEFFRSRRETLYVPQQLVFR